MPIFLHNFLWFLLIISVIVFIHEFGHFYVARHFGIRVEAFSIGLGKVLFKYLDKKGTEWRLSILPIGGYVKMYGDGNISSAPDFKFLQSMNEEQKKQSFYFKPLWQKALVVAAGPIANYLLAILIFISIFYIYGQQIHTTTISSVEKDSAAFHAGLEPGDTILTINEKKIQSAHEITQAITDADDLVRFQIARKNEIYKYNIPAQSLTNTTKNKANKNKLEGIAFEIKSQKNNISQATYHGIYQSYVMSKMILKALINISIDDFGGPIKIAQYSGDSAKKGGLAVFWLIAIISLNLGLVNLFPIPMLDGGHLVYYALEALIGKPLNKTFQLLGFRIGFLILIVLMILSTFNDIKGILFK